MNEVLLTVSGVIEPGIEGKIQRGERPQADYLSMARAFGADLLDYAAARDCAGWTGRVLEKIGGPNLLLAWVCFRQRRRYRLIFTDGEQVGIPLAFLLKFAGWGARPYHTMIAHRISVPKKMILMDGLGLAGHIDKWIVYSTCQQTFIQRHWKLPPERVIYTPFMVDAGFFDPALIRERQVDIGGSGRPVICAAGLEFRDYPTLIEAVRGLDVQVIIAAASPWSKRADSTMGCEIPDNVTVRRFTQHELREVYHASRFVVMPLHNVDFQAGVTAILEAMAMEKAVICTRTPGQTDIVVDGVTGIYVLPGDPDAMREAIRFFLAHPDDAQRMGYCGRKLVLEEMSLEKYVHRICENE